MKQSLLALAAAAALVVGSAAYTLQAAERVSVCHNDEEEGFDHVISISINALNTHLAHGDEEVFDVPVGTACEAPGLPE